MLLAELKNKTDPILVDFVDQIPDGGWKSYLGYRAFLSVAHLLTISNNDKVQSMLLLNDLYYYGDSYQADQKVRRSFIKWVIAKIKAVKGEYRGINKFNRRFR